MPGPAEYPAAFELSLAAASMQKISQAGMVKLLCATLARPSTPARVELSRGAEAIRGLSARGRAASQTGSSNDDETDCQWEH